MLAGPPSGPVRTPDAVLKIAGRRSIEPIWLNQVGGLTFRLVSSSEALCLKWAPLESPVNHELERRKLEWAISYTPVPRVLDNGTDSQGSWLLTEAIAADNAVALAWKANPEVAVTAIGRGLRSLHDSLPVKECPFSWSTDDRIARIHESADRGLLNPNEWSPEFRSLSVQGALARIEDRPLLDTPVVCHGDACAPNTLLDGRGNWVAHVDLESLGVGERWADLAVAAWSTEWNFGAGWDKLVYESYGVEPDPERIQYFRLLWDLL